MSRKQNEIAAVMQIWLYEKLQKTPEISLPELCEGVAGLAGVPNDLRVNTPQFHMAWHGARKALLQEQGIDLISISPRGPLSRRKPGARHQTYRIASDVQRLRRAERQGKKAGGALSRRVAQLRGLDPARLGNYAGVYGHALQKAEQLEGLALLFQHARAENQAKITSFLSSVPKNPRFESAPVGAQPAPPAGAADDK